jgi:PIN domain nuclease of toxin-antitoxin system
MNILADTVDFLWFCTGDPQLDAERRRLIEDSENAVFLSSASAAEIAIKFSIQKLPLPEAPLTYLPKLRRLHRFAELPIYEAASLRLETLPLIHRDPFDRLLVCQALAHDLHLLSSDPQIHKYPEVKLL